MKKRILRNEKGQALILVVGILAIVALLTSAALVYSKGQSFNAIRQKKQMQAYFIADAGITKAIAEIKRVPSIYLKDNVNMDLKGPVLNNVVNYGGGIIEVLTLTGPDDNNRYTLISTGKYPNLPSPELTSTKTITAIIKKAGGGGNGGGGGLLGGVNFLPKNPENQSIGGNVTIKGEGGNKGIIMVNGDLTVQGSASCIADVYASGGVSGKEKITGTCYENYPVPLPTLPDTSWFESPCAVQTFSGDNKTITLGYNAETGKTTMTVSGGGGSFEPQKNSIYLFKGDNIKIKGNYGLPFTIAVTGSIEIGHANTDLLCKNRPEGVLNLVALNLKPNPHGVKLLGNTEVDAVIVANGEIDLVGCSKLYGGITSLRDNLGSHLAGTQVITCCGAEITGKSVPDDLLSYLFPGIEIETWKE